jgi:hypothetical protein
MSDWVPIRDTRVRIATSYRQNRWGKRGATAQLPSISAEVRKSGIRGDIGDAKNGAALTEV